ncbi:unnamed protein product, partial [Coregonus sp. 'balchen']
VTLQRGRRVRRSSHSLPCPTVHCTVPTTTMSTPSGSPEREGSTGGPNQLELLEADSKSMRSMSGSRRNSGSSLVSSSSASSNLSHLEEDTWILWGRIVNEWDEWRRKKDKLLKELIRKGIPHHFRAIVWQLLGNATDMPVKNQYSELLKMSSPCEKLIRRDIARTYPEHEFFKGQDSLGQEVLFNVMKAYSLVDREVGYCQGSAFIVGLLLMQMPEEEAFCVFVRLMQEYRLRELFKPTMAELGLCIYQFEYLLQEQLPELNVHFRSQSFHTSMYASSWFLTLFLTFLPMPVATRIFDIFMYEFDSCPDKLILRAYQVKYNPKRMKKLEKEYTTIKNKEMEEQIEIKRLRTENRLLKQRIETLEKESAALADRLIQGQVTRAQEAEENYVIKRELAVVRQQFSVTSQNLEKAQDTIGELQREKDELKLVKLRELETLHSFREMQDTVTELNQRWQKNALNELQDKLMGVRLREAQAQAELRENQIHGKLIGRHEVESAALQERLQQLAGQNKGLQAQLTEMKRKQAELDCKSKEEVMAVRLREADSMAAMAELRQKIAELEIQKEEGLIQGQLNHSDSSQQLRGQRSKFAPSSRDGGGGYPDLCLASPSSAGGDYLSSDEDLLPSPIPPDAMYPALPHPHPSARLDSEGSTDSEAEAHPDHPHHGPSQQLYTSMVCAEVLDN